MARTNKQITVGAAPINIITGMTAAQMATNGMTSAFAPVGATFFIEPVKLRSVFAQMKSAGVGLGYFMDGITPGRNPSKAAGTDVTSQLDIAGATGPGGAYSDSDPLGRLYGDRMWVDGDNVGDIIIVSYDTMD